MEHRYAPFLLIDRGKNFQLMSQDRWLPAWVLDLLEINPSDSVLEVGSGPGVGLELAAARAYEGRIVGIDPSEMMLVMATHRDRALIERDVFSFALAPWSNFLLRMPALIRR